METRSLIIHVKDTDEANKVMILMNGLDDVTNVELLTPRGGHTRVQVEFSGDDDGIIALNRKMINENIDPVINKTRYCSSINCIEKIFTRREIP